MKVSLKTLSLFAIIAMIVNISFAQVQWGVSAGTNFSKAILKGNNISIDTKLRTGLQAGITADIPIQEQLFIQSALLFSMKGFNLKMQIAGLEDIDISQKLNYLELPVQLVYKVELGSGKLLLGAGPYLAYGISGKVTSGDQSQNIEWGKNKHYKPFDAGAAILFGYEFSGNISIQLNANAGLVNGAPENQGYDATYKNQSLGIRLGYKL